MPYSQQTVNIVADDDTHIYMIHIYAYQHMPQCRHMYIYRAHNPALGN